jgi:hypothetical protein
MGSMVPEAVLQNMIFIIRGQKVMIDKDLAELYGTETKVLNQAVKRNIKRFPDEFMFSLSPEEKKQLVTNCDRFTSWKHSTAKPYAFTEHGVAMLSSVLNSERAIEMNIRIIRAFIRLRDMVTENKDLRHAIETLEKRVDDHDKAIQIAFNTLKQILEPPVPKKPKVKMGFAPPEK